VTAVHAFHPVEDDDPYPSPTTAELLDRLCTQAETTRRAPDRIVADRILTGLNEGTCPECGWPTTASITAVSCSHCLWWWEL